MLNKATGIHPRLWEIISRGSGVKWAYSSKETYDTCQTIAMYKLYLNPDLNKKNFLNNYEAIEEMRILLDI